MFSGIRNAEGVIVRSILAILRVWVLFYVHLFSAATLSSADQDFFLNGLDFSLSNKEASLVPFLLRFSLQLFTLNSSGAFIVLYSWISKSKRNFLLDCLYLLSYREFPLRKVALPVCIKSRGFPWHLQIFSPGF